MPDHYFYKLIEEVGELAEVLRANTRMIGHEIKGTIEEELTDVLYYVAALANIHGIDLDQCFKLKDAVNAARYGRVALTK
jgi:NTP pyrophosphatase (non-canonical NTP hydrolase)